MAKKRSRKPATSQPSRLSLTHERTKEYLWTFFRLVMGWLFLWPFLDKLLGLGMATPPERAWIAGGSPTSGFLGGVDGPFSAMFNAMSGSPVIDVLFMGALLFVGVTFILNIKRRLGAYVGAILMLFIYMASLPLTHNPLIDDHVVYIVALLVLGFSSSGHLLSLKK